MVRCVTGTRELCLLTLFRRILGSTQPHIQRVVWRIPSPGEKESWRVAYQSHPSSNDVNMSVAATALFSMLHSLVRN
jgi:hypothetical protein